MTTLNIKKLNKDAVTPEYKTTGAAGFDIATTSDSVVLNPGEQIKLDTGLAFEIPEDYVMLVFSRSGHGFKNRVRLSNCVGVIDSDYRGELRVALENDGTEPLNIERGDRIAQGVMLKTEQFTFVEVDELSDTVRGTGGYGSTGVK